MAGMRFTLASGSEALVAATAETVLQIVAAANTRILLEALEVSGLGIVAANAPCLVELVVQTDAGTSSALTPQKNGDYAETLLSTARNDVTVEPTTTTTKKQFTVHPQGGIARIVFPPGREIIIPGGTRLGIRLTGADINTYYVSADCQE